MCHCSNIITAGDGTYVALNQENLQTYLLTHIIAYWKYVDVEYVAGSGGGGKGGSLIY